LNLSDVFYNYASSVVPIGHVYYGKNNELSIHKDMLIKAASHNWWKFDLAISYTLLPSQSILLSNQCFF